MTGTELLAAVTQMGFARSLDENGDYFYRTANFAIAQLNRVFPTEGHMTVAHVEGVHYYTDYDIGALAPRFLSFAKDPVFRDGEPLTEGKDYLISGSVLRVARGVRGDLEIRYRLAPRSLTRDNTDDALDVLPAAEHLLPLLCASYLWIDDREDLAKHYFSLYCAEEAALRRSLYAHVPFSRVSNGWG